MKESLRSVATSPKYLLALPLAVAIGAKSWLESDSRTGCVYGPDGAVDEEKTEEIFIRQGLFGKILNCYVDAVR